MAHLPNRPFLASETAALGISRAQLRKLVADNVVRRALHGVLVSTELDDTLDLRVACASLVLPAHAVVSDRSAAWLHGIDCYDYAEQVVGPRLEVVSIAGHEPLRRPELLGGKRDLPPQDICEVGGLLVTTPVRTACDVASLRGRHRAIGVLDAFSRRFDLEPVDFARVLPRLAGRRGVIQLRELIPLSCPLAESMPESCTRLIIHDEQLPAPQPQVWVHAPGHGWVRLDLAYEQLKIAVEYDGAEFHSSPADRAADDARREALRQAGWIVIVVRADGLSGPGRDRWVRELKEALAQRLPPVPGKRVYARGERRPSRPRRTPL